MSSTIFITPESKRQYNRTLFKEVAPRYDLIARVLSFGRDSAWKKWLLKSLPDDGPSQILDLACGTGDLTRALAERYPRAQVTGLDLTPEMLELTHGPEQIIWKEGDMCKLQENEETNDIITGGYALRNAPDLDTCLGEISRVLKPGGCAAFLDFSAPVSPLFRRIHYGLLWGWGAFWGLCLHGKPSVYVYIAKSLARFPDHQQLHRQLENHQLPVVNSRRFMLGMIEVLICKKN
ncbi:class I SAM-dependent methyltransferase [Kiritimatiellaeota bacterium B1221]|nr:class I SAM-dependent methyltransferase [Kiritimatiellaeota bacterium B1221]